MLQTFAAEALSISEACAMAGLGRTKLYQAIAEGSLKGRKYGRRRLILRDEQGGLPKVTAGRRLIPENETRRHDFLGGISVRTGLSRSL